MALNIPVFGGGQIIQLQGVRPNTESWGPPDMSKQLQEGIGGLYKTYRGAYQERQSSDAYERLAAARRQGYGPAAALGQPGGMYGGAGNDTLQPGAPGAPPVGNAPTFTAPGAGGTKQMPVGTEFGATGSRLMTDLQRDFGLTPNQAAGIAGPLAMESGGFKDLQEKNPTVPGSRGGFGFAQWTGPRRKQFEAYAAQNGLDPRSYEANYGFLAHELKNTPEGKILDTVKTVDDPYQAAALFTGSAKSGTGFLRPGKVNMEARMRWTDRIRAAGGAQLPAEVAGAAPGGPQGPAASPAVQAAAAAANPAGGPPQAAPGGGQRRMTMAEFQEFTRNNPGPIGLSPDVLPLEVVEQMRNQPKPGIESIPPNAYAGGGPQGGAPGPAQNVPAPEQVRDAQAILAQPDSTPPMKQWASGIIAKAGQTAGTVAQPDPTQPSPQNPTPITRSTQPLLPVPGVNQPMPEPLQMPPGTGGPGPVPPPVPGGPSMANAASPGNQLPIGTPGIEPPPPPPDPQTTGAVPPQAAPPPPPPPPAAVAPPPAQAPAPVAAPPPSAAPGAGVPPQGAVPGMTQRHRDMMADAILTRDPNLMKMVQEEIQLEQGIGGKGYGFTEVGGQLYRTNPMTGTAEPVAGAAGGQYEYKTADNGRLWKIDKTGREQPQLMEGGAAKLPGDVILAPNDPRRKEAGIPEGDTKTWRVRQTPDGRMQLEPLDEREEKTIERVSALAGQFEGNETVKKYRALSDANASMKASFGQGTAAGDINGVIQVLKAIDPGSTVTQNEQGMITSSGGLPAWANSMVARLNGGAALTPQMRADFVNAAEAQQKARWGQTKSIVTGFRNRAKAGGLGAKDDDPNVQGATNYFEDPVFPDKPATAEQFKSANRPGEEPGQRAPAPGMEIGEIIGNNKYIGGPRNDPKSWEPVR